MLSAKPFMKKYVIIVAGGKGLPHDTGTLTALKPCAFTASIIAFVVFGFPHDVSLERLFPPPIASRVFPKFQPVPMKLTSSVAVLPFISAADAT